ncbi:restriction endonuclease subunit S [Escherichia marmotae]|uniref:restriction endonuclease subunit S n=1 Tax=Escherichia marmotae TaxID=1499973 RepID=UPI0015E518E9|nr:restriction endonuclease subunit S [Escherichia marmotae]MBA7740869.1 restriction endonuclease subunit S [Escherichia marmotae]MBA7954954.1 restriction endonuclease subunit S [Escherichia marmotae]QLP31386.1 restriction endonuclease subunit S [Escherichia marmotae]
MGSKWIEVSLGEISEKIGDGIHGTPTYNNSGNYYFINGSNLIDNSIKITETTKCVDHDEYLKHRKKLSNNTVLVSINGTIGNTALYNNENIILGKSACYINLKDNISKHFILYVLSGYLFQEYIQRCSTGSTIKNVSLKMMRDFRFLMPESKEEQEKVVRIIQKIDELKRLNNAQNQTLEQMSQALFKSWFVDFDPVIDNALDAGNPIPEALQSRAELRQKVRSSADFKPLPAEICSLFPGEFEETELGWVPKGWCIKDFSVIAKLIKDNVKSENICDDIHYIGLEHLERKHIFITNYGNGGDVSSNKSAFDKNDLLFGKLRPYFHKVALAPFSGICSTDILVFRAKENIYRSLMAMYAFTDDFVAYANLRSTGTRMPRAEAKDLLNYKIVLPNKNVLEKFEVLLENYWIKGQLNNYENEKLTALRDTLLPKLISGKLSVEDLPDLIKQTEAA